MMTTLTQATLSILTTTVSSFSSGNASKASRSCVSLSSSLSACCLTGWVANRYGTIPTVSLPHPNEEHRDLPGFPPGPFEQTVFSTAFRQSKHARCCEQHRDDQRKCPMLSMGATDPHVTRLHQRQNNRRCRPSARVAGPGIRYL